MENPQRIARISRRLRLICTGLMFSLPVLYALFWVFFNYLYPILAMLPLPVRVDHDLPGLSRLGGFLADSIPLAVMVYGLRRLRELFRLYETGLIFTEDNVHCYRSLGRTLFVWVACNVLNHTLLGLVLTIDNPPGHRLLVLGLNSGDFSGIFVGAVVLTVAWIMDEARKIQDEQALIV
jgi:Protein of unknown function (DUF2975)